MHRLRVAPQLWCVQSMCRLLVHITVTSDESGHICAQHLVTTAQFSSSESKAMAPAESKAWERFLSLRNKRKCGD